MQAFIEAAKLCLTTFFLAYASWSDYKTREVSNSVWILLAPPAFALTFAELFLYDFSMFPYYGLCFALTSAFAIILFYAGGFGGADAKALMCLALALPFYPQELLEPLSVDVSPIMSLFFPITVFSNSVVLAALTAVYLFLYNVLWRLRTHKTLFEGELKTQSIGKKLLVLVTGYKSPLKRLNEKWHLYPLEDVEEAAGEMKRKLLAMPRDEEREAIVRRLEKAVEAGKIKETVWATPGLPMLIFITIGLLIALLYGDVIWTLIRFLMG